MKAKFLTACGMCVLLLGGCMQTDQTADTKHVYISFSNVGYMTGAQTLSELLHPVWSDDLTSVFDFVDLDALVVSNETFSQYTPGGGIYNGKILKTEDGMFHMQYESFALERDNANMPDEYWTSAQQEMESYMEQANACQCYIVFPTAGNHFSIVQTEDEEGVQQSFTPAAVCTELPGIYVKDSEVGWTADTLCPKLKLFEQDGFLVTEQYGYVLMEAESEQSFVLSYDNTAYAAPEEAQQMELVFCPDGTWNAETCSGTWELENHILAVFSPNVQEEGTGILRLFYLDFAAEQIYLPLYMQCDSLLRTKEE